ncbi:MAG: A/G-specific adenine glycosylase [Lysobacteraceae bacterium]
MNTAASIGTFAIRVFGWFDRHGRHDLPWQHPREPYRVWLSEIMLQQTQVQTAIPYFLRFVRDLPNVAALAAAESGQVMALWSGLGYYARARNLHGAAKLCVQHHGGELPGDFEALLALPGIGRSTAGAILAQAFEQRFAILDGNVKRVLTRWRGIEGWPGTPAIEKKLWELAESLLPAERLPDYTQALMDLGATLCTRANPTCAICPIQADCIARIRSRTHELPTAKPSKIQPERECTMVLAFDPQGRVLLQRRDGPGVWNGLWSLPQAEDSESATQLLAQHARFNGEPAPLPGFVHIFSHYRLHIAPLRWNDVRPIDRIAEGDITRWAAPDELQGIGLPAPVRKLLTSTSEHFNI